MPSRRPSVSTPRQFFKAPHSKKAYDSVVDLAQYNPLLFRISHRNSGSYYFKGEGVVANEHYSVDTVTGERQLNATIEELCSCPPDAAPIPANKLVEHVLYSKTERTNFVSTTFSFTWALFFAEMNASNWKEEDVELLVIDTRAVAHHAWVSYEQIDSICPDSAEYKKMLNAAYSSQEVIVLDCIPESAIISRVSWAYLKTKLPAWFYARSSHADCYEVIPIPNDGRSQRYVRWQKAVQDHLRQISRRHRGFAAKKEAVAFVTAVFDPLKVTDTEVVLLNGTKTKRQFEPMVGHAARVLMEWSMGSNSAPKPTGGPAAEEIFKTGIVPRMISPKFVNRRLTQHNTDNTTATLCKTLHGLSIG